MYPANKRRNIIMPDPTKFPPEIGDYKYHDSIDGRMYSYSHEQKGYIATLQPVHNKPTCIMPVSFKTIIVDVVGDKIYYDVYLKEGEWPTRTRFFDTDLERLKIRATTELCAIQNEVAESIQLISVGQT